jgi:hypothetical protein
MELQMMAGSVLHQSLEEFHVFGFGWIAGRELRETGSRIL